MVLQAPLGKVDFEQLGRSYELAGGSIKNAVRRVHTQHASKSRDLQIFLCSAMMVAAAEALKTCARL